MEGMEDDKAFGWGDNLFELYRRRLVGVRWAIISEGDVFARLAV